MKSFRENLRDELNFQGLTVKELSARTGIIKGSLDNYLGARASIPPADVAVKIAKALNVSVEYLVTGEAADKKRDADTFYIRNRTVSNDFNYIPQKIQNLIGELIHETASIVRAEEKS